ncbi:MAG TPA: hypothetical protein VEJ87_07550 [Acidimicrobiales bacterium]|nr:hypothetical protein [Acidimicrobiales bacterium]
MSLYYAQEKAYETLLNLGTQKSSLTERLASVFNSSFRDLAAEAGSGDSGLNPGLTADLLALFEEIQDVEPGGQTEDPVMSGLNSLDQEEVTAMAERVVLLSVETLQTRGEDGWLLETARE